MQAAKDIRTSGADIGKGHRADGAIRQFHILLKKVMLIGTYG